jgi:polyhydroxyalkanoate synthase
VGQNLAMTQGKVILQNDLMQLIQYQALTDKVHATPILIIPAWINKYYILDLQKTNSFVRWLVEKGYTVFMVSWVNPDISHNKKQFEDYMKEGALAAIAKVTEVTKEQQINLIGYCLGGTLLAATAAYLKAKQPKSSPIKTATFLTSLIDFCDVGDIGVFIDEVQISMLEKRMSEKGYLDGYEMAHTFSMIRANDMIWSFYINNYLLGKDPFPFDILYWNADSTRLPAKMHSFYLRNMYKDNLLVKPNKMKINGTGIDLGIIDLPVYILSTQDDHIAPWKSTYKATQIYKGKTRFVLSGSGHVAGVINHPDRNKYFYLINDEIPSSPEAWLNKAKEKQGSWWNDWDKWASSQSGQKVAARKISLALEDAPGSYVKKRL